MIHLGVSHLRQLFMNHHGSLYVVRILIEKLTGKSFCLHNILTPRHCREEKH